MKSNLSLQEIMQHLSQTEKGILAADESTTTIGKRFDDINTKSTENSRCTYRNFLFTTPEVDKYLCGAILFEETLTQKTPEGDRLSEILFNRNILPGIKVDLGLIPLVNTDNEKATQGLDGLPERLTQYKAEGAYFAKWRAVYDITDIKPSSLAIKTNAELLARYAAICQSIGIVPIVEPEVLMDGAHTIERCAKVTTQVLRAVFKALVRHKVDLTCMILKPNMVIPGKDCKTKASTDEIAHTTINVFKETVPAAVPMIAFLSGGQSDIEATENLQAMNALGNHPWNLSYSYGRALQAPALKAWQGNDNNIPAAQDALLKRCRLNSAASIGQYDASQE